MMNNNKINLRSLEPEDVDFLLNLENNDEYWDVSGTYIPFSRFQMEQYVLNTDNDLFKTSQLRLMVELAGVSIGCVDFYDFDPKSRRAGVGIIIQKEYQNKGAGKQALDLMIKLAFEKLDLHNLFALVGVNNTASIKLFEALGFEQNGIKKEWVFVDGVYVDQIFYQKINR